MSNNGTIFTNLQAANHYIGNLETTNELQAAFLQQYQLEVLQLEQELDALRLQCLGVLQEASQLQLGQRQAS